MFTMQGRYNTASVMIDSIDETTYAQILTFLNHPAFADTRIAIMPDCLHPNTEVLTATGFRKISDLNDADQVANYDPTTKSIFFKKPKAIINRRLRPKERLYTLINTRLKELTIVTENHRMAYIPSMGVKAGELPSKFKVKDLVWACTKYDIIETVQDAEFQFVAWIVGDGSIKQTPNTDSYRITFGLKKLRKIRRILELCHILGINPSYKETTKQTTITISTQDSKRFMDLVGVDKNYPLSYIEVLSSRQKLLFLHELVQVDGDYCAYIKGRGLRLNTSRMLDADYFSAIGSFVGCATQHKRKSISNYTKKL